jgi:hypothetical protein
MSAPILRVLSLGAGVQSTTLALMAAAGSIGPMPDCAIFADTGWEPDAVMAHLERLRARLPFPVYVVSAGNIRRDAIAKANTTGGRFASIPWFLRMPNGSASMGRRQCTKEYKLAPIQRKVVELMGGKRPKGGCEMWVGISTDEIFRMKPSRVQYITNRWPLIEAGMNRRACIDELALYQMKAPKSACIGCPFHSDAMWRDMRDNDPASFADAIEVDRAIRHQPGIRGTQFMHRTLVPLDEVDLRTHAEVGQPDLFMNECEGMCGV